MSARSNLIRLTVWGMVAALAVCGAPTARGMAVAVGEVQRITGPAELDLTGNIVYAVDVFGDVDRLLNGVTFLTDKNPIPGYDIAANNAINNWGTKPEFGGTADDDALEAMIHDIRWASAPSSIALNMAVTPGNRYKLTLISSENGTGTRNADIYVGGSQTVADYNSRGGEAYSPGVATVYTTEVTPLDGWLDVVMAPGSSNDRNPILQAVILEDLGADPTPPRANLALHRPVIAGSSAYNGEPFNEADGGDRDWKAANVTDGSVADNFGQNYWLANDNSAPEYFTLDLGQNVLVEEVLLRNTHNWNHNDRGTVGFELYASTQIDASRSLVAPQLILSGTLADTAGQAIIQGESFTSANGLTETTARYLQFVALSGINGDAGLNEIEVYGQGARLANLARLGTIVDGSGPYSAAFPENSVIDGSRQDTSAGNYWLGSDGDPTEYFTLDLGILTRVEEIHLLNTHNANYNDRGTEQFEIWAATQVNPNTQQLIEPILVLAGILTDTTGQYTSLHADVFTELDGLLVGDYRYLRFDTLSYRAGDAGVGLNEVEVYGQTLPEPGSMALLGLGLLALARRRR